MTNDVEIGTLGEHRVYMSFKDIKKIANKEVSKRLQKATEALRFYAYADIHKYHQDDGEMARAYLEEIEKCL